MKERPILFSAPMVRAILDGRKTQTRRVIKIQPPSNTQRVADVQIMPPRPDGTASQLHWMPQFKALPICPYGQPADRLWVRETWMPDGADIRFEMMKRGEIPWAVRYAASEPDLGKMFKWHPSIHMPRAASRLNLEITTVRVEHVRDISEKDAWAEGTGSLWWREGTVFDSGLTGLVLPRFKALWDSINAKRGFGWEKNPWVWVIEFKRAEVTA